MPSNMPDARAVEEALRRARESRGARRITRRPAGKANGEIAAGKCGNVN